MRLKKWFPLSVFLVFPLTATLLSRSSWAQPQDQETQVIELTAKKYEYSPSPFHINQSSTQNYCNRPRPWVQDRERFRRRGTEQQAWVGLCLGARLLAA